MDQTEVLPIERFFQEDTSSKPTFFLQAVDRVKKLSANSNELRAHEYSLTKFISFRSEFDAFTGIFPQFVAYQELLAKSGRNSIDCHRELHELCLRSLSEMSTVDQILFEFSTSASACHLAEGHRQETETSLCRRLAFSGEP